MKRAAAALGLIVVPMLLVGVSPAHAQYFDNEAPATHDFASPEAFALELRAGPYTPDAGPAFLQTFAGDPNGPLLALELDVLPVRIPYVGLIGVGAGIGWAAYDAKAFVMGTTDRSGESTSFTLIPVPVTAVLRVDVLWRRLHIPLMLTGKIGLDIEHWSASTGGTNDGEAFSVGLRWAAQAAFILNVLEPASAHNLDEEWGINNTFVFFEVFGSTASSTLPVGSGPTWSAGLGLMF